MAPAFTVSFRRHRYTVALRPDLAINEFVPWTIDVDGALYQLGNQAAEAGADARRFFRESMRSSLTRRTPVFLATIRYPLLLRIDGVTVRAFPMQIRADRWPVWMFESAARPRSECGSIAAEQTLDDVIDAAKVWLRGTESEP